MILVREKRDKNTNEKQLELWSSQKILQKLTKIAQKIPRTYSTPINISLVAPTTN